MRSWRSNADGISIGRVSHSCVEPTTSVSTNVTTPDGSTPAPFVRRRHLHGAGRPLVRCPSVDECPHMPFRVSGGSRSAGDHMLPGRGGSSIQRTPRIHTSPAHRGNERGWEPCLEVLQVGPPWCHGEPPHPGAGREAAGRRPALLLSEVATARRPYSSATASRCSTSTGPRIDSERYGKSLASMLTVTLSPHATKRGLGRGRNQQKTSCDRSSGTRRERLVAIAPPVRHVAGTDDREVPTGLGAARPPGHRAPRRRLSRRSNGSLIAFPSPMPTEATMRRPTSRTWPPGGLPVVHPPIGVRISRAPNRRSGRRASRQACHRTRATKLHRAPSNAGEAPRPDVDHRADVGTLWVVGPERCRGRRGCSTDWRASAPPVVELDVVLTSASGSRSAATTVGGGGPLASVRPMHRLGRTMKAAVCERYGPPEVVQIREVPKPVPADGEVLVKAFATTVNSGDARVRALRVPRGMRLRCG